MEVLATVDCFFYQIIPRLSDVQIIRLTFVYFNVQFSTTCSYDRIRVYDGANSSTPLGTFCGSMVPGDIISGSSYLSVSFESDMSVRGSGFEIRYEAIESQAGEWTYQYFNCIYRITDY